MLKSILLKKTTQKRALFFLLGDSILLSLSFYLAFLLRFDGNIPAVYGHKLLQSLFFFLVLKIAVFTSLRLYQMSWSYVGFYELVSILKATTASLFLLLGFVFVSWSHGAFQGFPRSVLLIDYAISLVFIVLFRSSKRFYRQTLSGRYRTGTKRTLIVGAGNAGEQIVRDMRRQMPSPYMPVGFVDDEKTKIGVYIQGIKVHGNQADISNVVRDLKVELVLIAIPSAPSKKIREIVTLVRHSKAKEIKIIPGLNELVHGNISLSDIKEIRIEDILGREQVSVDKEMVSRFLWGKTVLITGAGGSIGSELVRQVLPFEPRKIAALEIDETELHQLEMEIGRRESPTEFIPVLADICDEPKMRGVFGRYRPDVVLHAAAYKHVPMMEKYPEEAVKVNVLGTRIVAEAAMDAGVEKFVVVSTDKAVRPTNVMGATKRVAEKITKVLNVQGMTKFISVRFGNVVGSRGSVIPIFEEQIRKGGPVTVTHQEMKRYFMSIPEASILILQAAAMGQGGEVFLLDMGDPIKIVDMAKEMIRLNGLEPDVDIPIVYTGARPGEKLFEELLTEAEGCEPTEHEKIFVGKDCSHPDEHILEKVFFSNTQL
jgi:FlaA1/EpsC-like NDP-sugar epimerase